MSVESSFNYLTRSYERIYQENAFAKKIKLTEKSNKNIRSRAFSKLSELHDKKWGYKNNISELDEKLENIRVRLIDSNISDLERAQLRLEFQETKLERDKEVKLLPRRIEKIQKKMSKVISGARADLVRNEEKRPIKISDVSVGKFRKLMARFEAFHDFFRKNISILTNDNNVTYTSSENLEAAQSGINVSDIDPEEVEAAISQRFEEEEQAYADDNVQENNQPEIDSIEQQVSDFIDLNLDNSGFENQSSENDSYESELGVSSIESKNADNSPETAVNIDSMFGVEDVKDQNRINVEIPQTRVVETPVPVEEEINQTSKQETMEDYASKLDSLEEEFSIAANLGDIDKLKEIKASMSAVVSSINALKEKEESNFEKAQAEEQKAIQEEEEAKVKVINGLTSEIMSLMNDGDDGINYVNSLQQQTSATVARTNQIKVSIETLNSYATSEAKNLENSSLELDSMFEQPSSNNMTDSTSKTIK